MTPKLCEARCRLYWRRFLQASIRSKLLTRSTRSTCLCLAQTSKFQQTGVQMFSIFLIWKILNKCIPQEIVQFLRSMLMKFCLNFATRDKGEIIETCRVFANFFENVLKFPKPAKLFMFLYVTLIHELIRFLYSLGITIPVSAFPLQHVQALNHFLIDFLLYLRQPYIILFFRILAIFLNFNFLSGACLLLVTRKYLCVLHLLARDTYHASLFYFPSHYVFQSFQSDKYNRQELRLLDYKLLLRIILWRAGKHKSE